MKIIQVFWMVSFTESHISRDIFVGTDFNEGTMDLLIKEYGVLFLNTAT